MKEDKEVPKLENWVTLPEAARLLNVSNQMVHKMVFELKFFKTVRTVGDKPVYVCGSWGSKTRRRSTGRQERSNSCKLKSQMK